MFQGCEMWRRGRFLDLTFSDFMGGGVSTVATVLRVTWIWKTPGYHHLGAESNKVSRENFGHNSTICLNNIPYFIYKIWIRHRIKKWKTASCSLQNFWFFRTKKFFLIFFQIFTRFPVKTLWALDIIYA